MQSSINEEIRGIRPVLTGIRLAALRLVASLLLTGSIVLAGCGGGAKADTQSSGDSLSITPGMASIDTNCTGCNSSNRAGAAVLQLYAIRNQNPATEITWSLSGGDSSAGTGSITTEGQYTPPSYLTADRVEVEVTAALKSDPSIRATSILIVTAGFLQPLTPENVALGPNGTVSITGVLAEAGGDRRRSCG